jgi:hypothetical protein
MRVHPYPSEAAKPVEIDPDQIRFVGDLQRVSLQPDDAVVLFCDRHIPDETAARLKSYLHAAFGAERKCLVLGEGLRLAILGAEAAK